MHKTMERLYVAAEKKGVIGQTNVAKALDETPQTVNNWEARGMSKKGMLKAQRIFSIDANWLENDIGPMDSASFTIAPDVRDYVPLISMVQAGAFCEAMDNLAVGDSYEQIPTSYPKKRHTFALEVSGESMMPSFPPGMRLIVEPDMEYQSGDFVIAKNGGDATFKQIVKDGGVWYLKPLNPQFPTLPLADSHVIGVVREAVIKFR